MNQVFKWCLLTASVLRYVLNTDSFQDCVACMTRIGQMLVVELN